jgi:hypothetical protein
MIPSRSLHRDRNVAALAAFAVAVCGSEYLSQSPDW